MPAAGPVMNVPMSSTLTPASGLAITSPSLAHPWPLPQAGGGTGCAGSPSACGSGRGWARASLERANDLGKERPMRIGKQDAPYTAICTSDADSITVRGKDLVGEIIGKMDFTSYFWFLVTGQEPNEHQAFFANAVLCALAEHGLVPSVVAARMTLAAAPEAMQGAVAAGLLGCGSVVLGSAEVAGAFYANCVHDKTTKGISADQAARDGIARLRADKRAIPGFGH